MDHMDDKIGIFLDRRNGIKVGLTEIWFRSLQSISVALDR